MPPARISLNLSRHFSLSFIASGRSSGLHPVSSQSYCMYIRAGRSTFARPYVGVHRSTSLMSSFLLLQLCPAHLSIYIHIYTHERLLLYHSDDLWVFDDYKALKIATNRDPYPIRRIYYVTAISQDESIFTKLDQIRSIHQFSFWVRTYCYVNTIYMLRVLTSVICVKKRGAAFSKIYRPIITRLTFRLCQRGRYP